MNLIFNIIVPIMIFMNFSKVMNKDVVNFNNYYIKFQKTIIISIIIGIGVVLCSFLEYYMKFYCVRRLLISCLAIVLIATNMIFWSFLTNISITVSLVTLEISLSAVYILYLMIPFLLILNKFFDFLVSRTEILYKVHILQVIKDENNLNSISQIRKTISKNRFLEKGAKLFLLKNLDKIMNEYVNSNFIGKNKKFFLTKKGWEILNYYEKQLNKFIVW